MTDVTPQQLRTEYGIMSWEELDEKLQSQDAQVLRLTEENEALIGARNENAKLKGQREAALARIKTLEDEVTVHIEAIRRLMVDGSTLEATMFAKGVLARTTLKENAL